MSIGAVRSLSQESLKPSNSVTVEKKLEAKITAAFSKAFAAFLLGQVAEITTLIWGFLDPKTLSVTSLVSKHWKEIAKFDPLWATLHGKMFSSENKVPFPLRNAEAQLLSETCKKRYLETQSLFPNKLDEELYSKCLGEVKTLPIPAAFIKRAKEVDPFDEQRRLVKDTHQLLYVPKEIKIMIPAGSRLVLNAEGHLVEDQATSQEEISLIVPMTLNNLLMLTSKCLKKDFYATGISEHSWKKILVDHGNLPVKSHWSYQKKAVVGLDAPYESQKDLARDNYYEVSSLMDRVLLNFLTYVSSRVFVDSENVARTLTSVEYKERSYLLSICGSNYYQFFSSPLGRLNLDAAHCTGALVGVAVEVPSDC